METKIKIYGPPIDKAIDKLQELAEELPTVTQGNLSRSVIPLGETLMGDFDFVFFSRLGNTRASPNIARELMAATTTGSETSSSNLVSFNIEISGNTAIRPIIWALLSLTPGAGSSKEANILFAVSFITSGLTPAERRADEMSSPVCFISLSG